MKLKNSKSIFTFLRGQPQQSGRLITQHSGVKCGEGEIMHAIDSTGFPALLIPVSEDESSTHDWDIPAISIEYKSVFLKDGHRRFLVIRCLQESLESQFGYLIDDVLDSIASSPNLAVESTHKTIDRWKALLKEKMGNYLSMDEVIGLLGELCFLEEISTILGPDIALARWEGPNGSRHDFEFLDKSFEVKSTQSREMFLVTIHGSKQLEPKGNVNLYIKGYQFERSVTGISLPETIERLVDLGMNRFDLFEKLLKAGYEETHSTYYRSVRFVVVSQRICLVDSSFPKLTVETVDPEVISKLVKLSYSVDIGGLPDVGPSTAVFK